MLKEIAKKARRIILPLTLPISAFASASNTTAPDMALLNFEDQSAMSENTENLKSGLRGMLSANLSDVFDLVEIEDQSTSIDINELDEKHQGLEYVINGSYVVVNNRNITISSRVLNLKTGEITKQFAMGSIDELFYLVDNLTDEIKTDLGYDAHTSDTITNRDGSSIVMHEKDKEEFEKKKWSLKTYMDIAFPISPADFREDYQNSFHYGSSLQFYFGNSVAFVGINQKRFIPDWKEFRNVVGDYGRLDGGRLSFIGVFGGLGSYVDVNKNFRPFIGFGGGHYWARVKELNLTINKRKTTLFYEDISSGPGVFVRGELDLFTTLNTTFFLIGTYERQYLGDEFEFASIGIGID